jgi:hypothetical protein
MQNLILILIIWKIQNIYTLTLLLSESEINNIIGKIIDYLHVKKVGSVQEINRGSKDGYLN